MVLVLLCFRIIFYPTLIVLAHDRLKCVADTSQDHRSSICGVAFCNMPNKEHAHLNTYNN